MTNPQKHLIPLEADQFALWPWVAVRSTGFPAEMALSLAVSDEVMTAMEAYRQAKQTVEQLRQDCLTIVQAAAKEQPPHARKPYQKVIRQLKQNRPPTQILFDVPSLAELQTAYHHHETLQQQFEQQMSDIGPRLHQNLHDIATQPSFQEAIIWQNREAFADGDGWLGWFLRQSADKTNRRMRDREVLLANYLQRYCLKNDTIGFFGPVGWGMIDQTASHFLHYHPGQQLLAQRTLYFEQWGIDKLTNTINDTANLHQWLLPRRSPFIYIENGMAHFPLVESIFGQSTPRPLSALHLSILAGCDREQNIAEIATAHSLPIETIWIQVTELQRLGLLEWSLELPLTLHPHQLLRQQLTRIDDDGTRTKALQPLEALEQAYQQIATPPETPAMLHAALSELEEQFTTITGQSATHQSGRYYAGRNLVYEDCQRDMTLRLGNPFVEGLAEPLSLLLKSARWYIYRVAELYRAQSQEIYRQLVADRNIVSFYRFSQQLTPILSDSHNPLITQAITELQQKWAAILTISPTEREVNYQSQRLKPLVEATFNAPHAGWQWARYASPDVMLLPTTDMHKYQFVLGELHLFNNLGRSLFIDQHPNPDELYQARSADIPTPCVMPIPSKKWNTQRTAFRLTAPHDVWFAYETTPPPYPLADTLNVGELVVVETEDGLQVHTRDRRQQFDLIEFLGYTLSNQCMTFPALLPSQAHLPRLWIDDMIIRRESWHFSADGLLWAAQGSRADLLYQAHQWRQNHTIPRFVFVKTALEPKPFFVDFHSPIYLELFARAVRRQQEKEGLSLIGLTEMLPHFDELWLTDINHQRYPSELRLVVLDITT